MTSNDVQYRCSFCEKDQDSVKRLIAGPRGVFMCDECVGLATQILSEDAQGPSEQQ